MMCAADVVYVDVVLLKETSEGFLWKVVTLQSCILFLKAVSILVARTYFPEFRMR